MSGFNSQDFKIGPCAVIYKGEVLGMTKNSSQLTFKATYYDSKCARALDQSLGKRLTSMTISLTTEIMSVDNGLGLFLDENDRITLDRLGERQNPSGGELLLVPISPADMVAYRFPHAVLLRNSTCSFSNDEEHSLQLEFEANYVDGEEVLFEKIPVDEAQRVSLDTSSDIEPAAFERAMTYYIADKLNMTVDTDIFRGGIPVNIDGCGVEIRGENIRDSIEGSKFYIKFSCLEQSRDEVMKKVTALSGCFPVYGETLSLNDGTDVLCKAILKKSAEYNRDVSDDGKIKTLGELALLVII